MEGAGCGVQGWTDRGALISDAGLACPEVDGACVCRAIFLKVISCGVASHLGEFRIIQIIIYVYCHLHGAQRQLRAQTPPSLALAMGLGFMIYRFVAAYK